LKQEVEEVQIGKTVEMVLTNLIESSPARTAQLLLHLLRYYLAKILAG